MLSQEDSGDVLSSSERSPAPKPWTLSAASMFSDNPQCLIEVLSGARYCRFADVQGQPAIFEQGLARSEPIKKSNEPVNAGGQGVAATRDGTAGIAV